MKEYQQCVIDKALALSSLNESAENLAKAAQTACEEERRAARRTANGGLDSDITPMVRQAMDRFEQTVRERAALAVMERRLKDQTE